MSLRNFFGLGPPAKKEAALKISNVIEALAPDVTRKEGSVAARNQALGILEIARDGFDTAKQESSPAAVLLKTILSAVDNGAKSIEIYPGDRTTLKGAPVLFDAARSSLEDLKKTPVILSKDDGPIRTRVLDKEIDTRLAALEKVEGLFKEMGESFPPMSVPSAKTGPDSKLEL